MTLCWMTLSAMETNHMSACVNMAHGKCTTVGIMKMFQSYAIDRPVDRDFSAVVLQGA